MDVNIVRMAVTVLSFISFVGIWWWAWKSTNQARFNEWARVCVGLDDRESGSGQRGSIMQSGNPVSNRHEERSS